MALLKSITTDTGVAATYWRVVQVSLDAASGRGRIAIAGYLDAEARENGHAPLTTRGYALNRNEYEEVATDTPDPNAETQYEVVGSGAYRWIKRRTDEGERCYEFAGAEDV